MAITSPRFPSSLGPATSAHQTSEDQAHLCPHPVSVTQRGPSSPVASLSEAPSAVSQLNFNLEICPVAGQGQGPCGQERLGEGWVLAPALTSDTFLYKFPRKQGQSNFLHHLAFCSCPQSSFKNRLIHLPSSLIYLGSYEAKATLRHNTLAAITSPGEVALPCLQGQGVGLCRNRPALGLRGTCTHPAGSWQQGKGAGPGVQRLAPWPGRDGDEVTSCSLSDRSGGLLSQQVGPRPGVSSHQMVNLLVLHKDPRGELVSLL